MKIAIIEKTSATKPINYKKEFNIDKYDYYSLISNKQEKVLKSDLNINIEEIKNSYDLIILVGKWPLKWFTGSSDTEKYQGNTIDGKFFCVPDPRVIYFKPQMLPDYERSKNNLKDILEGKEADKIDWDYFDESREKELLYYLNYLYNNCSVIACDTETTALYPRDGYVLGIGLSHDESYGCYISSDTVIDDIEIILEKIFREKKIVFHNAKFDIKMLQLHFGFEFPNFEDTMLQHYVLDENSPHGLKYLALKYTKLGDYERELDNYMKDYCKSHGINYKDFNYGFLPADILAKYGSYDPAATLILYNKFDPILQKKESLHNVYKDILIEGSKFLIDVEENGVPFSKERLEEENSNLQNEVLELTQTLYNYKEVKELERDQGKSFNPNSTPQLRKLLFDYIGLSPTGVKTPKGEHSTNEKALTILSEEHEIPATILKIRKTSKLANTYITKIIQGLDADSRLRTNFNLHVATSGRLSSSGKLNMQQLPRDTKTVKRCIKAREGFKIVSMDLGTAEMYYAACYSQDPLMVDIFETGGDFHTETAIRVFNLPVKSEDPHEREQIVKEYYNEYRYIAKTINFSILYGGGAKTVSDSAGCSKSEAQKHIDEYFKTFKVLSQWLEKKKKEAEKNGYLISAFGRKRRVPNVFSSSNEVVAHEVRSAVNAVIQSVASDTNLLAGIDMQKYIRDNGMEAYIFGLVHDSILAEVREDLVDEYKQKLHEFVVQDRGLKLANVDIVTDFNVGDDYAEAA